MDSASSCDSFLGASISSDLALKIIQYLNVVDSGRLACASQRYYYLVHQYRRLQGPELVTTSPSCVSDDWDHTTMDSTLDLMWNDCRGKLQTKPNLVLHFSTAEAPDDTMKKLSFDSETIVLGAVSPSEIQTYEPADSKLDPDCFASLMAMNFPGATIVPFTTTGDLSDFGQAFLKQRLKHHNTTGDDGFWKAVILYSAGRSAGYSDDTTMRIQRLVPNAAIVGGVCEEGHVSVPKYSKEELRSMSIKYLKNLLKECKTRFMQNKREDLAKWALLGSTSVEKSELVDHMFDVLEKAEPFFTWGDSSYQKITDGTFGVILGGDVPVKSVVSRGVHSILNQNGPPRSFSNLVVEKVDFSKPGDGSVYLFGEDGPPVHMIRQIKDTDTGALYSPTEVLTKIGTLATKPPQFLGLKRPGHDGFELTTMNTMTMELNTFVVIAGECNASQEPLEGAEIDFFTMSEKSIMEDMDRTMVQLREQTKGEELLGALMYSCNGRGPTPTLRNFISEQMIDATRFARVFPDVPCMGFYAGGEFGPIALAGNENVFQTGRSRQQGFTAVFALFIVPVKDGPATYNLDDSINNVQQFVREQLHTS